MCWISCLPFTTKQKGEQATILTPTNPNERGCQLSVKFKVDVTQLNDKLGASGVIADVRKPHVIRYLILSHTRRMGNLFFLDLRRCPSITPLTRYIALLASLGTPCESSSSFARKSLSHHDVPAPLIWRGSRDGFFLF